MLRTSYECTSGIYFLLIDQLLYSRKFLGFLQGDTQTNKTIIHNEVRCSNYNYK